MGGAGTRQLTTFVGAVAPAASVLKKFVRLASAFPSPPFGSSDFAGPRRPRLYGFHTGTGSLSNRKGRGRRSGRCTGTSFSGGYEMRFELLFCILIDYVWW